MRFAKIVVLNLLFVSLGFAQLSEKADSAEEVKKPYVDFYAFSKLVNEVESHRAERLVTLNEFLKMSKDSNTVILDTRSDYRFERKHVKGAIHLDFTDFTQENLAALIPDRNTRILIYCNNNFEGDQIDFATKIALPARSNPDSIVNEQKPLMLALNIPTYINLYGYGYRNVYELNELVSIRDSRIEFEGTETNISNKRKLNSKKSAN
ncbi:MAG: rhodanese-like domain-containing protein [Pyrinomonadaceae bacterium]